MPHPYFGPPVHDLEVIYVTLRLPTDVNGRETTVEARGESPGQRSPLWTYKERWSASEQSALLQPCDAAHHLLLTAAQDRPRTKEDLTACLGGRGWEDVPLPY